MTLSPAAIVGALVAGLLLQAVVAFIASLISGARMDERIRSASEATQAQIADVKQDVADIKRKLGNGGEGVFLRTDLAKEIISGLANKDTAAAETIASLRTREHDQTLIIQSLQNDVAILKAVVRRSETP